MFVASLIAAIFATNHAVTIWRESDLFAGWRAHLELGDSWFTRLMLCRWCLSVWVGFLFAGVVFLPDEGWYWPPKIFMFGLALSSAAWGLYILGQLANTFLYEPPLDFPHDRIVDTTGEPKTGYYPEPELRIVTRDGDLRPAGAPKASTIFADDLP